MSNSTSSDADSRHTNLSVANVASADMTGSEFSHADMHGADWDHADPSHAILYEANLAGAHLT
jgi:uncharacterized protein YjbI with pentapeptide repeats